MADDVPQWALNRAVSLIVEGGGIQGRDYIVGTYACRTFARYIAEHEEPPVDPLLVEAREIVAEWWERNPARFPGSRPEAYRDGSRDADAEIEQALTALRRGIELGKAGEQ